MTDVVLPGDSPYHNTNMLSEYTGSLPLTNMTQPPQVTVTLSRPVAYVLRRVVIENFNPADWH